ncbi:hypothetical protein BC830DRAFT_1084644 [Chytriomyces sp. MP71]|nr:hypothetical protein BC830DRAFT_1084644 [Chytriomyces sp. MP71]
MWEIKNDLGDTIDPSDHDTTNQKGGSSERGYSIKDEARDAIKRAIMLTVLNRKTKSQAGMYKKQPQLNNKSKWRNMLQNSKLQQQMNAKGKKLSSPSANSNASLNCKMCLDMTSHSTEDCNKLKNFIKLKDQCQKGHPTVKNALQKRH